MNQIAVLPAKPWYDAKRVSEKRSVVLGDWLDQRDPAAQRVPREIKQGHVRRFHAARMDNTTANWFALESSINQELQSDLDRLRARGRDLRYNNDWAAKFCQMCGDNIIGPSGIRLQAKVTDDNGQQDRGANNAIEGAWERWGAVCDITGRQTLRDLCASLMESMPSDGEFLIRMIVGADAQNEFNFALQRIDVDRIDTTYNGTFGGNTVIMGVEINASRRAVALHIFEGHPADGQRTARRRVRIPAEELIHGFECTQADQVRGIPWMAPGMLSLHHLGGFGLAALLAAEHGANHYGFFKTPDGKAPALGGVNDAQQTIMTSQPGVYDTLPSGVDFTPHESKYPNEVFGPFVKTTLQRIASGWRVAYHSLANDLEGVNFSSIRSGTIEERDHWSVKQEWFIAIFLQRIYPLWLRTSLLSGAITLDNGSALPGSKYTKFLAHTWQPRRWEWVDPKNDMEAKILGVKAGLLSPQSISAAMGEDFEDVIVAIDAAQKLAAKYGVRLTAYDATPGANGAATQTTADPVTTKPKK
jgi:lambda family phage portal protein